MVRTAQGAARKSAMVENLKSKKGGTASMQKHCFQSFSQRIAKFSVDPVRRAGQWISQQDETSYFHKAMEDWKELNMSENFTCFVQQIEPLCQSLPQILHYRDEIMDSLIKYLKKADALCIEPLLSLTAHFAHDLGTRFEVYFESTVATVSCLAAKNDNVDVIEWSFTCLAWLFKYLSRLLVPNLLPLYNLMAPLLGKERQKSFVTRFAAEAMSFLVRKVGANCRKNQKALNTFIEHTLHDLENCSGEQLAQYQSGIILLFTESIKGIKQGIHSSGQTILRALLVHLFGNAVNPLASVGMTQHVVECILVNVAHHTDKSGFNPLFEVLMNETSISVGGLHHRQISVAAHLLLTVVGVENGSRVTNWSLVLDRVIGLVDAVNTDNFIPDTPTIPVLLNTLAVVLQFSPLDVLLFYSRRILDKIGGDRWEKSFLAFCVFAADIGFERFESLVMPDFQKFIANRWEKYEEQLCFVLPKLIPYRPHCQAVLHCPSTWQQKMLKSFQDLHNVVSSNTSNNSIDVVRSCSHYIDVIDLISVDSWVLNIMVREISKAVRAAVSEEIGRLSDSYIAWIMGKGLLFLIQNGGFDQLDHMSWLKVYGASTHCRRFPRYLLGVIRSLESSTQPLHSGSAELEILVNNLITNLSANSHDLKLLSLEALEAIYHYLGRGRPAGLETALILERTTFSNENSRSASLHIRKLTAEYEISASDMWMKRALPMYCFGLLHVRLASVWDYACVALQAMCKVKGSGDLIMTQAMQWLNITTTNVSHFTAIESAENSKRQNVTESQCSTILGLQQLATRCSVDVHCAGEKLTCMFGRNNQVLPQDSASQRAQALKVLNQIPRLAESRSRLLVPILLQWVQDGKIEDVKVACIRGEDDIVLNRNNVESPTIERWARKDQKALLDIFAQFVNPGVLYRSDDVYNVLLGLLRNGDIEVQRSALKAIFAWRHAFTKPYEQNLISILDDARFREEVTVFLNVRQEEGIIMQEHRVGLMPVLLRLLYGRVVARSGSVSSRRGQESRRNAVLEAVANLGSGELDEFIGIALGSLDKLNMIRDGRMNQHVLREDFINLRSQVGLLKMVGSALGAFSNLVGPFTTRLVDAVLYCLIRASYRLIQTNKEEDEIQHENLSLLKSVRHEGLSCLNALFATSEGFDWTPYEVVIKDNIIYPRLEKLPIETAQAVSGTLKIFSTWSASEYLTDIFLSSYPAALEKVADCLVVLSAQDEVKLFVLNRIIKNVIQLASRRNVFTSEYQNSAHYVDHLLRKGFGSLLLKRLAGALKQSLSIECIEACVWIIINLEPFVESLEDNESLIETSIALLRQSSRDVNPRMKGEILRLLERFIPSCDFAVNTKLQHHLYIAISPLFGFFQVAKNRHTLVSLLYKLAQYNKDLLEVAELCKLLNSFSPTRLDEPDFEGRIRAFHLINNEKYLLFTAKHWQPLLHNILFLMKDSDASMRTSASFSLRRFVQATNSKLSQAPDLKKLMNEILLPAVQKGMREPDEFIRTEYVYLLAEIVKSDDSTFSDMQCLLGADDESSFFINILHIQQHRRIRALHRLAAQSAKISSNNIARFCVPLIENYISDVDGAMHNLAAEAISTLDVLAEGLAWQQYRALLQRTNSKILLLSKIAIRTLAAVVNGLSRAHIERSKICAAPDGAVAPLAEIQTLSKLAKTLPEQVTLSKSLQRTIIPSLLKHLHFKDDAAVNLRAILAVVTVKVIMALSDDEISNQLPAVIMDVCNILRSKDQEARDTTRKTLADISALVGPSYFGFILKQLRSSLQRGYQVHVLSYTVHSILVSVAPKFISGDLDHCLPTLMAIIIDDIFGATSEEKEAQDYISKMKEVRGKTLSFDTMELLGSISTLQHVSELIKPIQIHLDKPRPRLDKVDELLRRLREGLRQNEDIKDQQLLKLCHEILQGAYQTTNNPTLNAPSSYKMAAFALDLLRRALDKHENLKTVGNLLGLMPLLKISFNQKEEEVQIAAIRLLTSIIKVPLKAIDADAGDYIKRAKCMVEEVASINTPLAQSALRLVSAILRERPHAIIKQSHLETQIGFFLDRIKPELQEPARQVGRDSQVAAFNFLKAVLCRGVLITEIYNVMDTVREVMITSSEKPIPDVARSVYSRFLLDYFPDEGKGISKQVDFLRSNLQYPHATGRHSIMEVIHFILTKKDSQSVQARLVDFFPALLRVLVEDDSRECRDIAQVLLRKTFERADRDRTKMFRSLLQQSLDGTENVWRRVSLQCWALYFEVHTTASKEASGVYKHVAHIIQDNNGLLPSAMVLLKQLCELFPSVTFAADTAKTWAAISVYDTSTTTQDSSSAQVVGMYLADFARHTAKLNQPQRLPMTGSGGLKLTEEDSIRLVRSSMTTLQDTQTADQAIQNLSFIGRIAAASDTNGKNVLDHLIKVAAGIARSEATLPSVKLSVLKLIGTLCKSLPVETIAPNLQDIMLPLRNLTDPSIPVAFSADPHAAATQEELFETAHELLSTLQTKIGTMEFVGQMQQVQKEVRERREERRAKRRIGAVSAPEKMGREKVRRNAVKKEKRREKNWRAADKRSGC